MNHLREMIEVCERREMMTALPDRGNDENLIKLIEENAEKAVCFFGEFDGLSGLTPIKDLCKKFPYESNWFEFAVPNDYGSVSILGLLAIQGEIDQGVIAVRKHRGRWEVIGHVASLDGKCYGEACGSDISVSHDFLQLVRVFITAMRCNNVKSIEHKQPENLQKKRIKRGKKPLFSYWTLELKQERTNGDPLGGTHASPRLHLRRGHPRQFAPGKWTWVQPCVVGNKAEGMVHKDYRLAA